MIDIKNITKSFGSLQVLKGIDLHVDKGEVVSISAASTSSWNPRKWKAFRSWKRNNILVAYMWELIEVKEVITPYGRSGS